MRSVRSFDYCKLRKTVLDNCSFIYASIWVATSSYHQDFKCTDQPNELYDCYYEVLEEIGVQRCYVFWGWWYHS